MLINQYLFKELVCGPFAAFSLDTELPDYDLDSEDDTFVNKLNKKMQITALQFEEMIDRLEKGSGQQVFVSWHMHRGKCSVSSRSLQLISAFSLLQHRLIVSLAVPPVARQSPGGQTAAEGGRRAHQGGF